MYRKTVREDKDYCTDGDKNNNNNTVITLPEDRG
jgi:hypothetical protein